MTKINPLWTQTIKETKRRIASFKKALAEMPVPAVKRGLAAGLKSYERSLKSWEDMVKKFKIEPW